MNPSSHPDSLYNRLISITSLKGEQIDKDHLKLSTTLSITKAAILDISDPRLDISRMSGDIFKHQHKEIKEYLYGEILESLTRLKERNDIRQSLNEYSPCMYEIERELSRLLVILEAL